ncbi:MAG: DEAD/DEAH box helicase [Lachnospiraceae bacterium]
MQFKELGLNEVLINGLKKERIMQPTKVQELVIPKVFEDRNLLVQSETGSGKTLAYLLPLCMKMQPLKREMTTLVLVPTHELAMQVHHQVQKLAKNTGVPFCSTTIVGNVNIKRQIEWLREKPQIVIGTPGRVLELIKKKKISAHTMKTVVIDEADKLLDKNNNEIVKAVLKCCMRDTKLLMFSASIPKQTILEAKELRKDMVEIRVTNEFTIPKNLQHFYVVVDKREKIETLRKLVSSLQPKKAMIFTNKAYDVEETLSKLRYHHYSCGAIHGQHVKQERKKIIQEFGQGKLQFLVATDIAARGLHFEDVEAVFHLSIPEEPTDYLHRAGRAGRGKEEGLSVSIVTTSELPRIKNYEKAFGIQMIQKTIKQGKLV